MKKKKKTIISVSRRTDIPAYYADWFRKRLEIGYTNYPNPMNPNSIVTQSLLPEDVKCFVFWTRNPNPLMKHLDYLDETFDKRHYMHFTINGQPESLELRNPKVSYAVDLVKKLYNRYGQDYVQWRYDPIVISDITPESYIIDKFGEIANHLNGLVKRCYFSFVDYYAKTKRNFAKLEKELSINFREIDLERRIELTLELKRIADSYNMTLHSCAEDDLLEPTNVFKAHCVDADLVKLFCREDESSNFSEAPSRIGCGCIDSRDIGYYDSCPHGCIYCYANTDPDAALQNARNYLKDGFSADSKIIPQDPVEPDLFNS